MPQIPLVVVCYIHPLPRQHRTLEFSLPKLNILCEPAHTLIQAYPTPMNLHTHSFKHTRPP